MTFSAEKGGKPDKRKPGPAHAVDEENVHGGCEL
jgi:hypothetical protein